MTAASRPLRHLLHPLAVPQTREEGARALAGQLELTRVLLYVRDPALGVMLPAPGMPKTLAGGPSWRAFLRRCMTEPRATGEVELADGAVVPVQAIAQEGAALVLAGRTLAAQVLDELQDAFPLLAALLHAEQALHIERAEATEARDAATRTQDLVRALDNARAASAELNLQLRREHERKDEFLAMLSHELRNPLSPLVNSIEILRRAPAGADERSTRQLEVMARQLQQLTRLVDDLLDVSRVSRGLVELRRERVPLDEILDDAVEAARPLIDSRGHILQRAPIPAQLVVNGDRVRLTQVFANLLTNAAKYTAPGGRIGVSLVMDGNRGSVVVQDNGIGIPQDMLQRVFDMFTQVSPSARAAGGLGIGLTLVRRLVELHGGRVSAYSRGEGQGSTFTVSLPQVQVGVASRARALPPRPVATPAEGAERLRVLVVDDHEDAGQSLATLLEYLGAQVRIAKDGESALRLATDFAPALVLMDIALPGMDGYQTAARMRRECSTVPRLVALTGYGSAEDRERSLRAGFDEHLVKPVEGEALRSLMAQAQARLGVVS